MRARVRDGDRGGLDAATAPARFPVSRTTRPRPRRRGRAAGEARARRPRHEPGHEAGPAAAPAAARDRRGDRWTRLRGLRPRTPAARSPSVEVAPPGLHQPAPRRRRARGDARRACSAGRPTGAASRRSGPRSSTSSSSRPTRPGRSPSATPAARSSATCCAASSRPAGSEVTREYYFNDSGAQVDKLGASVRALRRGRAGARGRLPRRLRRATSPRAARRRLGRGDAPTAPTRPRIVGALGGRAASGPASRPAWSASASTSTSGRREGSLHDEGWVERAVERLRGGGHVYEQDGALVVPLDGVRRRQGPRHHPLQRRADLLRGRHRLRDREVQPRLRPPHLHLGRRPPRDRGAASGTPPRRWASTATRSRCC